MVNCGLTTDFADPKYVYFTAKEVNLNMERSCARSIKKFVTSSFYKSRTGTWVVIYHKSDDVDGKPSFRLSAHSDDDYMDDPMWYLDVGNTGAPITADNQGHLYIYDHENRRIKTYSAEGKDPESYVCQLRPWVDQLGEPVQVQWARATMLATAYITSCRCPQEEPTLERQFHKCGRNNHK